MQYESSIDVHALDCIALSTRRYSSSILEIENTVFDEDSLLEFYHTLLTREEYSLVLRKM